MDGLAKEEIERKEKVSFLAVHPASSNEGVQTDTRNMVYSTSFGIIRFFPKPTGVNDTLERHAPI